MAPFRKIHDRLLKQRPKEVEVYFSLCAVQLLTLIFPFHGDIARVGYENNRDPAAKITCSRNSHFLLARIQFGGTWIVQ